MKNITTYLLLLITTFVTAQYKFNPKAPLNDIPLKYTTQQLNLYGDIKKIEDRGLYDNNYHFNSKNLLIRKIDNSTYSMFGNFEYTYNQKGQVATSKSSKNFNTLNYSYNNLGFIEKITHNDLHNTIETFTYNNQRLLIEHTSKNNKINKVTNYKYDDEDRVIEKTHFRNNKLERKTTYKYTLINGILKIKWSYATYYESELTSTYINYFKANGTAYDISNYYDKYGNIIKSSAVSNTIYFNNNEISSKDNAIKTTQSESENFQVVNFENGDIYEGSVKNSNLHGKGVYKLSDGTVINGGFNNNLLHGMCYLQYPNGDYIKGNYINGKRNGHFETFTASSNKVFKHIFKDDKVIETLSTTDATIANNNDTLNEVQDFTCLSGNCKNGYGKFSDTDGTYEGDMLNNQPHGNGTFTYINGGSYSGEFNKGLANGKGVLNYVNGSKYEGTFVDWKKNGYGVFTWTSGSVYKGNWVNDARHGYGELYFSDGDIYKGAFTNDNFHGKATYYSKKDDTTTENYYENGTLKETYSTINKASSTYSGNTINQIISTCSKNTNPTKCYIDHFKQKKETYVKAGKSQTDLINFFAHDLEVLGNYNINYAFEVFMDSSIIDYNMLKALKEKLPHNQQVEISKLAQKRFEEGVKN